MFAVPDSMFYILGLSAKNVAEYCWIVLLPILSSNRADARFDIRAEPYSATHVQPYSAKSLFPRKRAKPYSATDDSNVKTSARNLLTLEMEILCPNRTHHFDRNPGLRTQAQKKHFFLFRSLLGVDRVGGRSSAARVVSGAEKKII